MALKYPRYTLYPRSTSKDEVSSLCCDFLLSTGEHVAIATERSRTKRRSNIVAIDVQSMIFQERE